MKLVVCAIFVKVAGHSNIMKIPDDVNTRAESMWRIISQRVDFRGKSVIDLGCGHGEMLWRAYIAGAKNVTGFDINHSNMPDYLSTFYPDEFHFVSGNLNTIINGAYPWYDLDDIAICFSVLPYLDNPFEFATWMAKTFSECLIEVQYYPEPYNIGDNIRSDKDMYYWLGECGFATVIPLGKTDIEIRSTFRTIWYCTKEEKPIGLNNG